MLKDPTPRKVLQNATPDSRLLSPGDRRSGSTEAQKAWLQGYAKIEGRGHIENILQASWRQPGLTDKGRLGASRACLRGALL